MYCNRCGHRNPPGANFCSSCGAPLERRGTDLDLTTTSIPAVALLPAEQLEQGHLDAGDLLRDVPEGGAALVVTRGPNEGSRFVLSPQGGPVGGGEERGVVTIGRHPDSDIFLDDITVSRRHAEVRYKDGVFWAYDVGSLNGTYLNRQSIESAPLSNGDELQVGKFRLVFLALGPGAGAQRGS